MDLSNFWRGAGPPEKFARPLNVKKVKQNTKYNTRDLQASGSTQQIQKKEAQQKIMLLDVLFVFDRTDQYCIVVCLLGLLVLLSVLYVR